MKYVPHTIVAICQAIAGGSPRTKAAKKAGINFDTFCEWMRGDLPNAVLKKCKTEEELATKKAEFSEAIKKAETIRNALITTDAVFHIHKAMKKSWQAAAWWLERTDPEFRQKTATDITSQGERVLLGLPVSPFANGEAKKAWDQKHPSPKKK